MPTLDGLVMVVATIPLLAVDWLAFHDFREPHTVRDWLMLLASLLVLIHFGRVLWKGMQRRA